MMAGLAQSAIVNPNKRPEVSAVNFFNNTNNMGFAPTYNNPVYSPEIFIHVSHRKLMINK